VIDLTQNPYGKYNGNEMEYLLQALDSDNPKNKEKSWPQRFEEEFCRVMGVKYAIACNSGTSGLHAALAGAGIGPGDEVINPALTVVMDAYSIIHVGATPVFADVDPDTQTIDPEDVRKKITSKTRAIITVSLQGLPVDIDPIMDLAQKKNLTVIEDSAQTILGMYNGRIAGTLGHIGVFSFENKKHMSCGSEGGMIVSNDEYIAQRIRKFAGIGYKHMTAEAGRTSLAMSTVQDPDYERFDTLGLNYRMTEVSAAIGLAQFERIESMVSRRQAVAKIFDEAVGDCDWMVCQKVPEGYVHAHYTYTVKYYGEEKHGVSWKQFYNQYKEMGGDGFYGACKVPYLEPVFNDLEINGVRYGKGLCSVAEEIQPRIMQFKTNYRNLEVAKEKAEILNRLINKIGK
jgi:perosamine synthetase